MKRLMLLLVLLAIFLGAPASSGRAAAGARKLLVVVIDDVTWQDLSAPRLPDLRRLATESGVGLMTVQTGDPDSGSYLTIGAGACASGGKAREGFAFNAAERANRRTALVSDQITHLAIEDLKRSNRPKHFRLTLGLLGGR